MGMNTRINPIGIEDQNPKTLAKKKEPWEITNISGMLSGIGSYNVPLVTNIFDGGFTGKAQYNTQGASFDG